MTVKRGVQISGGAIANEFDIRDVNAPYRPARRSALEETAKALYIRKLRHGRSGSRDPCARAAAGPRSAWHDCGAERLSVWPRASMTVIGYFRDFPKHSSCRLHVRLHASGSPGHGRGPPRCVRREHVAGTNLVP
jgi:hypothetical protein